MCLVLLGFTWESGVAFSPGAAELILMDAKVRRFMLARRGSLSFSLSEKFQLRKPRSAGSTFPKTVADRLTDNGRRFAHVLKP